MSLLLSWRHTIVSLVMTMGFGSVAWLIFRFPVSVLILPGIWMFFLSFGMERIFRKYMKEPEEGEEIPWYWEDRKEIVQDNEKK